MTDGDARVTALYLYPVKGCGGVRVESARVVARGFERDRRYMVVDPSGRFVSQRELPQLTLVRTALTADTLVLHRTGQPDFSLPLELEDGRPRTVSVWGHDVPALEHAGASEWISAVIGAPLGVVYMPGSHRRPVNPARALATDVVSFADAYPFLAISEASLADLNARLDEPLSMERFRPNIVVGGVAPYAEDDWRSVSIGSLHFRGPKRCDRCSVTTVDPRTGERGKEPLSTLASYRREEGKVWFGMNLIHDGEGEIAVGDLVTR